MESRTNLLDKAQEIDGEQLRIIYVRLDDLTFWADNPKKHDIDGLIESMLMHGFRDAPIFDDKLNDGKGGIAGGNGRLEALMVMYEGGHHDPPRGILLDKDDGMWCMPIQFGINAESEELAEAFAVDHNNLTLGGSGLGAVDIALLWNDDYPVLLEKLDTKNVVSITDEDMKILRRWQKPPSLKDLEGELGEDVEGEDDPMLSFRVSRELYELFWGIIGRGTNEEMRESLTHVLKVYEEVKDDYPRKTNEDTD